MRRIIPWKFFLGFIELASAGVLRQHQVAVLLKQQLKDKDKASGHGRWCESQYTNLCDKQRLALS